jgi:uncharacterized protein YndB with AHSA1/START domain
MTDNSFLKQYVKIERAQAIVFAALTRAPELQHWFPSRAESDPRVGGKIMLTFEFAEVSQNGTLNEKYLEVIPNEKVSYTWGAGPAAIPTIVTFYLKEEGGATTLELDHSRVQADADKAMLNEWHANNWTFYLTNLKGYLEKGTDQRKNMLHQVTA